MNALLVLMIASGVLDCNASYPAEKQSNSVLSLWYNSNGHSLLRWNMRRIARQWIWCDAIYILHRCLAQIDVGNQLVVQQLKCKFCYFRHWRSIVLFRRDRSPSLLSSGCVRRRSESVLGCNLFIFVNNIEFHNVTEEMHFILSSNNCCYLQYNRYIE